MKGLIEYKKHIYWCVGAMSVLFLLSVWHGYFLAISDPQSVKNIIDQTLSQFDFVKDLNAFLIFLFIFLNNAIKGFLVMFFGIIFGFAPMFFIFANGELIGLVLGLSSVTGNQWLVALAIAPHGILEIPAIILSAGYGLWLGYRFYRFLWRRDPFRIYLVYALKKYVSVVVPFLFVAALVETFITPLVIGLFN